MKKTRLLLMAVCVVLWMLLACGDGGDGVGGPVTPDAVISRVGDSNTYICEGEDCGSNFPVESSNDVAPVILPEWEVKP